MKTEVQRRPSYEEIAGLAYEYWQDRGDGPGSPEGDWLRAERDLCLGIEGVGVSPLSPEDVDSESDAA